MGYKGIIFDLDGVIVSTDHFHYLGWKKLADEEHIYFDEEINHRLRGVSRMQSLEIVLERAGRTYSDEEKTVLAERKNRYYIAYLEQLNQDSILPGVPKTLDAIRQNNIKTAIGSSSRNAGTILTKINLGSYFDAVADGNDITRSKPDPEIFLVAAQKLSLLPADLLVVEDAKAGIDAAVAAGMDSAAIGDAVGYVKATYHLDHINDLINIC